MIAITLEPIFVISATNKEDFLSQNSWALQFNFYCVPTYDYTVHRDAQVISISLISHIGNIGIAKVDCLEVLWLDLPFPYICYISKQNAVTDN